MLLLPFILHAGLGLLLLTSRLRRSPDTRRLKERLTPTISGSVIPLFIESFYGDSLSDSLSRGVMYLSRVATSIATSQVSTSGPVTRTDVVIYDPRSTDVIVYTDYCIKHGRSGPLKRPRFSSPLDRETDYGPWEATIEEEPWVIDVPLFLYANHVRQSRYIDPEDSTYTFARGTSEEPSPSSTSSSSDGNTTPATEDPASQATHRSSRQRKSSRRSTKKESTGRTSKSRKGRKVEKAPKSWRDKLLRTVYKVRSRFAQLPRHTRERATLLFELVFYSAAHFFRNRVLGFIHRHIKVFVVYAVISYLGVHAVCMAVERHLINMHPAFAVYGILFEAVLQDFLRDLPTCLVPWLYGLVVELIEHRERRRQVLRQ
ncbi:hypothetical protein BS17DRAFT_272246 [Gyrodon lividus]|nr:hypothetical protein BS17DRAFT_272246 [Gyrodon lividus]